MPTPAQITDFPRPPAPVPSTEAWARLLHRDRVGKKEAAERKEILADIAYSVSYYRQISRPSEDVMDTGYPCHLSRTRDAFSALVRAKPETMPEVYRLATIVPDAIRGEVVLRRQGTEGADLVMAAAAANQEATQTFTTFMQALSPESDGGTDVTKAEAEAELPRVERSIYRLQVLRRELRRIARGGE